MSRWSSSGSIANYPNYSMYLDGLAPLDSVSSGDLPSRTSDNTVTASGSGGSFQRIQTQTQTGPPSRPLSSGAYVYGDHGLVAGFSDFQYSPAAISSIIADSRPLSQAAHQSITVPSGISYIAHSHFSAPSSINPNPSFLNSNIPASNDTSPNSLPESSALVYSYPLKVHYPIPGLIPSSLHSQHPPPINTTETYPSSVATQSVYDHQNIDMAQPSPAKKQRTRLYNPPKMASSKDFVPPDVSGLSKREARLVKNRAAAYLSRQKKREAFEELEQQVLHLQHENAYLRSLLPNLPDLPPFPVSLSPPSPISPSSTPAPNDLPPTLEALHAQLASSKQRERSLIAEILSLRAQLYRGATSPSVEEKEKGDLKYDDDEEEDGSEASPRSVSTSASSSVQTPILEGKMFGSESDSLMSSSRAGTSLGLMALICALPTILKGTTSSSSFQSLPAPSPYDPLSPTVTLPVPFPLEIDNEDIMMSPVGLPFGGGEELMLSSIIDPELLAYDYDVLKTKRNAVDVDDERVGGAAGKSCGNEKGDKRTELMVSFGSASSITSEETDSVEVSFEASTGKEGDGEKLLVRLYVPASSRTTTSPDPSSSASSSSSSPNLQVSPSPQSESSSSSSPSPSPYLFPDSDKAYAYPILSNPRLGILDPLTLTPEAREHFKTAVLGPFLGAGPSTLSSHSNGHGIGIGLVPDEFSPLTDNPPSIPHTSSMNFRTRPNQQQMFHSPFSSDSFSVFEHDEANAFGSLSPSPSLSSFHKLNANGNGKSSKRVRISLVATPVRGVEGGEWRVEVV